MPESSLLCDFQLLEILQLNCQQMLTPQQFWSVQSAQSQAMMCHWNPVLGMGFYGLRLHGTSQHQGQWTFPAHFISARINAVCSSKP